MAVVIEATLRPPGEDDWAYIYASWKRSYWDHRATDPAWTTLKHKYLHEMERRIVALRESARFVVATDPSDDSFILGWGCFGPDYIHYIHVRETLQRMGLAEQIAHRAINPCRPWSEAPPIQATHWTTWCEDINKHRPGALTYAPSLLEAK